MGNRDKLVIGVDDVMKNTKARVYDRVVYQDKHEAHNACVKEFQRYLNDPNNSVVTYDPETGVIRTKSTGIVGENGEDIAAVLEFKPVGGEIAVRMYSPSDYSLEILGKLLNAQFGELGIVCVKADVNIPPRPLEMDELRTKIASLPKREQTDSSGIQETPIDAQDASDHHGGISDELARKQYGRRAKS